MKPMAEARIDLDRLARNIRLVREHLPSHVKILFAVKRDAYGHGLIELSLRAQDEGVDWLGVADLLEAKRVRDAGLVQSFPDKTKLLHRQLEEECMVRYQEYKRLAADTLDHAE